MLSTIKYGMVIVIVLFLVGLFFYAEEGRKKRQYKRWNKAWNEKLNTCMNTQDLF